MASKPLLQRLVEALEARVAALELLLGEHQAALASHREQTQFQQTKEYHLKRMIGGEKKK